MKLTHNLNFWFRYISLGMDSTENKSPEDMQEVVLKDSPNEIKDAESRCNCLNM